MSRISRNLAEEVISVAEAYQKKEKGRMARLPIVSSDLIERVAAATGADDALDKELWLLGRDDPSHRLLAAASKIYSHPTSSVDAALGLVSRVLPGMHWMAGSHSYGEPGAGAFARVYPGHGRMSEGSGDHYAPTPALALILAMLRALEATRSDEKEEV